jgi:hypothetical protein
MIPFLRAYLERGTRARALLSALGFDADLPAALAGLDVSVSYSPPSARRLDVIRPTPGRGLARNLLGGRQRAVAVDDFGLCRYEPGTIDGGFAAVGCGSEFALQAHALTELRVGWTRPGARIISAIPAAQSDLRAFRALTVRVGIDVGDTRRNPAGVARPFSVALRDSSGAVAVVRVPGTHPAVRYPTRPIVVLGTVRLPLSSFAGLDLRDIVLVEIRFDRTRRGRLLLTDLSFVR